jgi:hypothetical protein
MSKTQVWSASQRIPLSPSLPTDWSIEQLVGLPGPLQEQVTNRILGILTLRLKGAICPVRNVSTGLWMPLCSAQDV